MVWVSWPLRYDKQTWFLIVVSKSSAPTHKNWCYIWKIVTTQEVVFLMLIISCQYVSRLSLKSLAQCCRQWMTPFLTLNRWQEILSSECWLMIPHYSVCPSRKAIRSSPPPSHCELYGRSFWIHTVWQCLHIFLMGPKYDGVIYLNYIVVFSHFL